MASTFPRFLVPLWRTCRCPLNIPLAACHQAVFHFGLEDHGESHPILRIEAGRRSSMFLVIEPSEICSVFLCKTFAVRICSCYDGRIETMVLEHFDGVHSLTHR